MYTYAATGPRTDSDSDSDSDWQSDALAVMNRAVDDPRGWITLDWDKKHTEELKRYGPSFPFVSLSGEKLVGWLSPVTVETAARLLVTMTFEWGPVEPEENTRDALADAWTLLGRYGDDISCYSNISAARDCPAPDLSAGVTGYRPLNSIAHPATPVGGSAPFCPHMRHTAEPPLLAPHRTRRCTP